MAFAMALGVPSENIYNLVYVYIWPKIDHDFLDFEKPRRKYTKSYILFVWGVAMLQLVDLSLNLSPLGIWNRFIINSLLHLRLNNNYTLAVGTEMMDSILNRDISWENNEILLAFFFVISHVSKYKLISVSHKTVLQILKQ